jgi:hypothetical protein
VSHDHMQVEEEVTEFVRSGSGSAMSAFGGQGLIFFNGLQKSIEAKAASNSGTISGSSVTNRANRNAVGERSGFVGAVSNQAK